MSFAVTPGARNGHEVGGKFLSRILRSLCVGSLLMHVRVAWGIWAQMESAETVTNLVVSWSKRKEETLCRCQ